MSMLSRILRCDDAPAPDPHAECHAAAATLEAAYQATVARLEAENKVLRQLAGVPADVVVLPARVGGWRVDDMTIEIEIDEDLIRQLVAIAERTRRPINDVIELACRAYVHWHAAGTSEEEQ